MEDALNLNMHYLLHLRRDRKYGGAPHKPILLLAITNLIERSEINSNLITVSPELVLEFKDLWSKLVITPHLANFALPFFHMKSEPFWKLVSKRGMDFPITSSNSIRSLRGLKEALAYAEMSKDIFTLMSDPIYREVIRQEMLEAYFPESRQNFNNVELGIAPKLSHQMLNENKMTYKTRIGELRNSLNPEEFEEEVFVRSGVFQREVPRIYNYQCAVSGMRIESTTSAQMVDACHIEPFSINGDDTIRNGISLCPNIHRAFDRGLLTIDNNYLVQISGAFIESDSPFSLRQFEGKQIQLPELPIHYPSIENLRYHRKGIFVL